MKTIACLAVSLGLIALHFGPAFAEAPRLEQLARDYLASSAKSREEAQKLAESQGWPVRGVTSRGRAFELQRLLDGIPLYYTTFNINAARTTRTDSAQVFIGLGGGATVGLWDAGSPRTTHQELYPRVTWADSRAALLEDHSTHVAGTMIGAGVRPQAKGMMPQGTVRAYEWNDDLAEMANEAAHGLLVSNHSYGPIRGWYWSGNWYWFGDSTVSEVEDYKFGFYDDEARKLDELLNAAPNYLVVNSAGNDRNDSVGPGTPHLFWDARVGGWRWSSKVRDNDGAPYGYDCIPNGFTIAKNSLTIGAVKPCLDYTGPASVEMTPYSSWGPTDDGRVKPDVCGDGWDVYSSIAESDTSYDYYYGTSMASPNVCGSLGLLQKAYRDRHHGAPMRAATLKALAIHTAREAGPAPGPDYAFGWGLLDAYAAYRQIALDVDGGKGLIEELTLNEGAPLELSYRSDGAAPELRVTICWTDPPGTPPVPALDPGDLMLVNNLDLRVSKDAAVFEPWVLDPANPLAPAARGENVRDNVEQVVVDAPEEGLYVIRIDRTGSLAGGSQSFSLIVSGAERAKTWNVYVDGSGDAPTIAAAVDSAATGDCIFVYPGIYREHDIVIETPVMMKGVYGPALTYVDAEGLGRCFVVEAGAGSTRIEDLTIEGGRAEGAGAAGRGGALLLGGDATLVSCVIRGSRAQRGGAVYADGASPELLGCGIYDNVAAERGGGVYLASSQAVLDRCVLARNSAAEDGGALCCDASSPSIARCTMSGNSALGHGGALYAGAGSEPSLEATIVAFNAAGGGLYASNDALGVSLSCCDVYGNEGGDFGGAISDPAGADGNFSANPELCDAASLSYGIGDGSPCLPGGNGCGVLIGARDAACHSKTLWNVAADGTGDAPTIQAAIDRASDGDTILLAAGTYTGAGNRDIYNGGKALVIKSAAGAASTIIDCESPLSGAHTGFEFGDGEDSTSVLEGLTITRASLGGVLCTGASPAIRSCAIIGNVAQGGAGGGGIRLDTSTSRISDCVISGNRAVNLGGGIFCKAGRPRIERSVISGNSSTKFGGGIVVQSGAVVEIRACEVSADTSVDAGGGIYVIAAAAVIDSCVISTNDGKFGGGIYNGTNATCTLRHSVLRGNIAWSGGGGVYSSSNMSITGCTIVRNSAAYYGGGIEATSGAQNSVARSIVALNENGSGIYTISGTLAISCSDVYSNAGGNYLGSTPDQTGQNNNFSSDPQFCGATEGEYGIYDTSPCASAASPCAALVGALDVSCRIAPNLVISRVALGATSLAAGDSTFAEVTVKNTGAVDADTFDVDFYRSLPAAPGAGQHGDERLRVAGLAVGDSITWTTSAFTSDTIGTWTSWAAVDVDGAVIETREDDNASGPYAIAWGIPAQPGWPVARGADGESSPLLVDLDGNPATLEIVVGCWDGKLYAWNADGESLPGWPVDLGGTITTAAAAGDIAGDSRPEVVVINSSDQTVRAYDVSGVELWHAFVLGHSGTTPVLADLDGDGKREVLVAGLNAIYLFEGDGNLYAPSLIGLPDGTDPRSPAVGDVDGDGSMEIAAAARSVASPTISHVYLFRPSGILYPGAWPVDADTVVSADPVIGDIAPNHEKMEIVVVGENGIVYAWAADGLPCLSHSPGRAPGTVRFSPSLASLDRDGYHDVVFSSQIDTAVWKAWKGEGYVNFVSGEGVTLGSTLIDKWESELTLRFVTSPIVIGGPPTYVTIAPDTAIHADSFGFPVKMGSASAWAVSPAAGDIDGDGWVELIAASGDSIYCLELRSSKFSADALWWPQFRRDAARTACYGYEPLTGVDDGEPKQTPAATALRSVYPNPFNPTARIRFDVSARGRVELSIFDIAGRRVSVLVDREIEPGAYEAVWSGRTASGRAAASGVYFCRLKAGGVLDTRKLVLLR